jgi:hypothetical protein
METLCFRWQYLIIVVHHLCDDLLFRQRKSFVINKSSNIFIFIVKLYFNTNEFFFSYNPLSNLECQCIQFQIHFMFINIERMKIFIIYNLDNDNVCTKFAHLHCKLQYNCPILLKSTTIQLHRNP